MKACTNAVSISQQSTAELRNNTRLSEEDLANNSPHTTSGLYVSNRLDDVAVLTDTARFPVHKAVPAPYIDDDSNADDNKGDGKSDRDEFDDVHDDAANTNDDETDDKSDGDSEKDQKEVEDDGDDDETNDDRNGDSKADDNEVYDEGDDNEAKNGAANDENEDDGEIS